LSPDTKKVLAGMGIDFSGRFPTLTRPAGLDSHYDPGSGFFRFHYTVTGDDAVDPSDGDGDGVPDYVNTVADAFRDAYNTERVSFGLEKPPSDGWYPENGGNELYDVYVHNLGPNYYGETVPEKYANNDTGDNENSPGKEENAFTSYINVQNDFGRFPPSELESIQVTAAHELFHAIQFGYDGWEAVWLLEATATWMEDEVFDDVNDNYQYLKQWFQEPHIALDSDTSPHWYGSWIFFRYLSEHAGGPATVRKIFEQSVRHNSQERDFSILTIDEVLRRQGTSFGGSLSSMAIANQILSSEPAAGDYSYEEASDYRDFGIRPTYRKTIVLSDTSYTLVYDGGELMRNASHYTEVIPASGPLKVSFLPVSGEVRFRVNGIVRTATDVISVHDIGNNRIILVPQDVETVVLSVVTDTMEDGDYNYSIVLEPEVPLPSRITLYPNFPNPFNATTTFRFFLPKPEEVTLSIFDLLGRNVGNVYLADVKEGFNDTRFDARHLPSGVYVARLNSPARTVSRRFTLIK
ncbi:MAG: MXAN_6640 family putative metalloprotease, partial [Fidelibacterota bacterium]